MAPYAPDQRAGIEPEALNEAIRAGMNRAVATAGHHPGAAYDPAAFRHYTREIALLDALAGLEFASALDVGCAEGFFMASVGERFEVPVWGVDISDLAVEHARRSLGLNVAAADAQRLPLPDGAFDLVYSTETIEHVLRPETMLAEMRRVSRRWVLVTTPISQPGEHEADYGQQEEGHINFFDRALIDELFGSEARIASFRCNVSFGAIKLVGRHGPAPMRNAFYGLDRWLSKHVGGAGRPLPIRNRDWLIIAHGEGPEGERRWCCPTCHRGLGASNRALRCPEHGLQAAVSDLGVPDFVAVSSHSDPAR